MIAKVALKSIVRTPVKSVLFLLLVLVSTAFLGLGIGLLFTADQMAADADERYKTVVNIEYIGENYPNLDTFDDDMIEQLSSYDPMPLFEQDEVISYERQLLLGASAEGFVAGTRQNEGLSAKSVLRIKVYYDTDMGKLCLVTRLLFGQTSVVEGSFVYMDLRAAEVAGFDFELGEEYLVHVTDYEGENRSRWIMVTPCDLNVPEDYSELAAMPIVRIDNMEEEEREAVTEKFENIARTYNILSNKIYIRCVTNIENAMEFYLGETEIVEGELYAPTDENACVISEYIAEKLNLSVGDTLSVDLYGSVVGRGVTTSFWYEDGYLLQQDYEVVGIFKNMNNMYTTVFALPPAGSDLGYDTVAYQIGLVEVENSGVDEYLEKIRPYLLGNMRANVYDQGYSRAFGAIAAMRSTAVVITSVSFGCAVALLLLYAYLFVLKQRDTSKVMMTLGTGRKKTLVYFIVSSIVVLLLAAAIGSVLGWVATDELAHYAYESAVESTEVDVRFSASSTSLGPLLELAEAPTAPFAYALPAFALIVGLGFAFSLAFALITIKKPKYRPERKKKKKRSEPVAVFSTPAAAVDLSELRSVETRKSFIHRFAFTVKLIFRSVVRNRGKSVVVPLVTVMMSVFVGLFCHSLTASRQERETVYDRIPVTAYLTNYKGTIVDKLRLTEETVEEITANDQVVDFHISQNCRYQLMDASYFEVDMLSSYGMETYYDMLRRCPFLVGTTDIRSAAEFFFEGDVGFTFIEGYDESVFSQEGQDVCLVNAAFLENNGLQLGDTVSLQAVYEYSNNQFTMEPLDLKIVGEYPSFQGKATIYCPFDVLYSRRVVSYPETVGTNYRLFERLFWNGTGVIDPNLLTYEWEGNVRSSYYNGEWLDSISYESLYNSLSFTVADTENLAEFRDEMEALGLSSVGQISAKRLALVIDDAELMQAIQDLDRQTSYMWALFIVLFLLTVGIGFVISNLLTKNRKAEFAMMRSMGAGRTKTFFIFALEQIAEFLIGLIVGLVILYAAYGSIDTFQWTMLGIYSACYIIGIMIAAQVMNRLQVLDILGAKE
ncbi:MAG: hypothetical protein Q4C01_02285 [Clostridia bacterium]|nr:hypothetical protein [Clostridia bacterium]